MEIKNYDEQPVGNFAIAVFDVDMRPEEKKVYKRLKLCRSKKGHLFINAPAFKSGEEEGKSKWEEFVEWTDPEEKKGFNEKILNLVKPFLNSPVPF